MVESVKKTVLRHNMFKDVNSVTVALSGGADSVALLSVLLELSEEFNLKVYAAHLNHCLRGEESDRDEMFVRDLCKTLGIELFCERANVSDFAKQNGMSIELAARKVRYEFLARVGIGAIATAHTASDNIETFLHNAVRGTGIKGLCGIPYVRGRFVRPLLTVTRADVEEYCRLKGLLFQIDSTNANEQYTRNRIRHSVVPKLCEINSAAVKNVTALCDGLSDDADYLDTQAKRIAQVAVTGRGIDLKVLNKLHVAIKSRIVAEFYEKTVGVCPERMHINSVLSLADVGEGRVSVQNDFVAEIRKGCLRFVNYKAAMILDETVIDSLPFSRQNVEIRCVSLEEFKILAKFNNLLLNHAADCDKISGKLKLRGRKPADKIALLKRGCTKTFKNLFNEASLSKVQRDSIIVVSDDEGVVWLQQFGVDRRVAVDDATQKVVVFLEKGSLEN